MHMHNFAMTTLTYASSWSKQHGVLNMPHLSNPSNDIGMVKEHGKHSPANTLGKTSERLKSRSKNNYCTLMSGKEQSNFSLEHFQYQLPNEHSGVGFLIDAIQCADTGLQAAMASVKMDNGPHGLQNNFERAVSHLLPYDPMAKKRATGIKRGSALISLAQVHDGPTLAIATNDSKPSIGKTGVHLCYHKHNEYKKLMHEQRHELSEWRQR